jgi:uncharacterized protein
MTIEPSFPLPPSIPDEPTTVWRGRDILLVSAAIIFLIGAMLGGVVLWLQAEPGQELEPSIWLSGVQGAVEGVVLLGSIYFLALLPRRLGWSAVGIRRATPEWIGASVLIGLAVIPITMVLVLVLYQVLGLPPENPQLEFIAPEGFSWLGLFVMLLFGGLIAPIAEEVYFRGFLYDWMRARWNPWAGNIVSSILFGVAHLDLVVGLQAFLLGILLAWTYERSRSLWPAVIIHILNNALKIVLLYAVLAIQP